MRRVTILSIALLGGLAAMGTSCSSGDKTTTITESGGSGTGGSATSGGTGQTSGGTGQTSGGTGQTSGGTGQTSGGTGASTGGTAPGTGGTAPATGGTGASTGGTGQDSGGTGASTGGTGQDSGGTGVTGGVTGTGGTAATQVGTTNPATAVQLPGDYLSGALKGYCYTYGDFSDTEPPVPATPSSVNPPCNGATCFSQATGMCIAGSTGISTSADSYAAYGVGIGCAVNQDEAVDGGTTTQNALSVASMTNIVMTLYGDTMPTNGLQISVEATGGTQYCAVVASASVAANTPITVPLSSLKTECWGTTGTAFDPATMSITKLQIQLRSGSAVMPYDMCVSQFSIS